MAGQTYGTCNVEVNLPDGRGNLRAIYEPSSAATSFKEITVPAGVVWDVQAMTVILEASANVGNRLV